MVSYCNFSFDIICFQNLCRANLFEYILRFVRKNDPCEAVERIAKGMSLKTFEKLGQIMCNYACNFAGVRSRVDVGVINHEESDLHYFINVADVHL